MKRLITLLLTLTLTLTACTTQPNTTYKPYKDRDLIHATIDNESQILTYKEKVLSSDNQEGLVINLEDISEIQGKVVKVEVTPTEHGYLDATNGITSQSFPTKNLPVLQSSGYFNGTNFV